MESQQELKMNRQFKVIKIDPEGSGMDYGGHLGFVVNNAKKRI